MFSALHYSILYYYKNTSKYSKYLSTQIFKFKDNKIIVKRCMHCLYNYTSLFTECLKGDGIKTNHF